MFKRSAGSVLLVLTIFALLEGPVFGLQIEQAHVNLPEIDLYVFEDAADFSTLTEADISASLGGEALTALQFGRSEQGILYVYMLDISASMPKGHFDAAKAAVLTAYERLRGQDALALLTFGNEVTVRLEGGESRSQIEQVIASLECKDGNTRFYEAMGELLEIVEASNYPRRIAVVVSDGIDDADAAMTQQELEEKLKQSGVAVSALCLDTSGQADTQRFAGFIHLTGGELYSFGPADAEAVLGGLLNRLDQGWHLQLAAGTNIVPTGPAELKIDFGALAQGSFTVDGAKWIPDKTAPKVKYVKYDPASGQIRVSFSEAVDGADDVSRYVLTAKGGAELALASAAYEGEERSAAVLTPGDLAGAESFTLTVSGLRDISMERNLLEEYSRTVYLNAGGEPTAEVSAQTEKKPAGLLDTSTMIIIGVIAVAIAGAFAALLILSSNKRRANPDAMSKAEKKAVKKRDKAVKGSSVFVFSDKDEEK